MDLLAADRPRDNLQRAAAVVALLSNGDFVKPAPAGREERRMPTEQPVGCQWLSVVGGRIEYHLDHALDIAVSRCQPGDFDAEVPCYRGSDLVAIEFFAFDLARADHVLRQRTPTSGQASCLVPIGISNLRIICGYYGLYVSAAATNIRIICGE